MGFQSRHPKMAPVRFIPANDNTLPAVYSTYPVSRGFFRERLQYWQAKQFYYQKWNSEDNIVIYFDSAANLVKMYLVDVNDHSQTDVLGGAFAGMSPTVTETANTFESGGAQQYYTFYQPVRPISYAIPDGVYVFILEHIYSGGVYTEVSEPVHIRAAKWETTRLIEYTNSKNELVMDYVLFQQVAVAISDPMIFGLRVEAHVDDPEPFSADTQFVDMGEAVISLQSHPYQVYNFNIGTGGVPAWLLMKVAAALSCNTVSIDAQSYVKDQGATFAVKKFDTSGFRGASVKLRDADPENVGVIVHGAAVELMELIGDGGDPELPFFPCAWSCLTVIDSVVGGTGTSAVRVFESLADLDSYIVALNTDLTTAFGAGAPMRGYLTRVGLKIYYNNAIGEHWIQWTGGGSYTYSAFDGMVNMTARATSTNTFAYTVAPTTGSGTRTLNVIVDYGDGTVIALTGASGTTSIGRSYAAGGDYNVRIFHSGSDIDPLQAIGAMQHGAIFPAPDTNVIRYLSGTTVPAALESFVSFNTGNGLGSSGGSADFQFLAASTATLVTFLVWDSSIADSINNVFGSLVFSALNDVDIRLGFNTAEVNDIVADFSAMGALNYASMTGGTFRIHKLSGGTAPPTGSQLAFLDVTLAGLPCTVNHD